MLGCPNKNIGISLADIFLSPYLQPSSSSSIPRIDPALLKGLSWGDIQTLKFGQADNSFHITKEQLPLLFSPRLWISQVFMKLSSKKLSDIINTLFVCAVSSSKHFHNSKLALCALEAGTVKIKQLELLLSELGLPKFCSPALLEVWREGKRRSCLMDSVCLAKQLTSFPQLHRHDSSLYAQDLVHDRMPSGYLHESRQSCEDLPVL